MPLLVDTGVLYALADRRDAWHRASVAFIGKERARLLVPVTVVPEVAYLLHTRLGSAVERRFVASLQARELDLEPLKEADLSRCATVMDTYPDIGFVDATIVAMAERLKIERIATTDRRHFERIVPAHAPSFTLVPEPPAAERRSR